MFYSRDVYGMYGGYYGINNARGFVVGTARFCVILMWMS